jgi:hypothetical protein
MPLFDNSAFGPPFAKTFTLSTSWPNYAFGERSQQVQPFLFTITSVALAADVATIGVTIKSGGGGNAVPMVGAKCGVQGTATNGGAFNVDPSTVTAVDYDAATGTGTISFALEHANVAQVDDVGQMVVQSAEIPDLIVAGSASRAFALGYTKDEMDNERSLFCEAKFTGTVPTSATVVLQIANVNSDERFQTVGNAGGTAPGGSVAASDALATIAASAVTQSGATYNFLLGRFVRAKILALEGGDDTTGIVVTISA